MMHIVICCDVTFRTIIAKFRPTGTDGSGMP